MYAVIYKILAVEGFKQPKELSKVLSQNALPDKHTLSPISTANLLISDTVRYWLHIMHYNTDLLSVLSFWLTPW